MLFLTTEINNKVLTSHQDIKITFFSLKPYIKEFSYRQDALSYTNAVSTYVEELLSLFYDSDEAVRNDSEVQNWIKDVVENGLQEVPNFGLASELKTRKDLFEVCSRLICQVSIGHATFGFVVPWSKLMEIFYFLDVFFKECRQRES